MHDRLDKMAPFRAYVSRIEGDHDVKVKENNFRHYVVEGEDRAGYKEPKVRIRINPDHTIHCSDVNLAPTKEEAEAIKAAFDSAAAAGKPFPHSVGIRKGSLPKELKTVPEEHTRTFLDRTGKLTLMIEHRKDGDKKKTRTWSYWSDGQWRMMEPDKLPLWALDEINNKKSHTIFMHEGPWAAKKVAEMIARGGDGHPLLEHLKDGIQMGWPGGATNAYRVDWQPIIDLVKSYPSTRFFLVCDNDGPGKDAAKTISKILQIDMFRIEFDDNFPVGFDLADPWPRNSKKKKLEWWKGDRYRGPRFEEFSFPSTWATYSYPGKKGAVNHGLKLEFAKKWIAVDDPPVFVHRDRTDIILNDVIFNRKISPFSNAPNTAKLLVPFGGDSKADGIMYNPGKIVGINTGDGEGKRINTFRPSILRPFNGAAEKDWQPFVEYMEHLIPVEHDRTELMRWVATLIDRLDVKMLYGVLLISEKQGVGKSTLGESILEPIVGRHNTSVPNDKMIADSIFNSWAAHKRLAIVHEIYAGHKNEAYNCLKSLITEKTLTVNKKYFPEYRVENWIHVFACSNSKAPLQLEDDDRRWMFPKVTEELKPREYWDEFHRWLTEDYGLEKIMAWARDWLTRNEPVRIGDHAPDTELKTEVIMESRSAGAKRAYDLGLIVAAIPDQVVLTVNIVRSWVASCLDIKTDDKRLEKPQAFFKALTKAGLKVRPGLDKRLTISGTGTKDYVVANFNFDADATWSILSPDHWSNIDLEIKKAEMKEAERAEAKAKATGAKGG
jgi:hypothetical protein